MEHDELLEILDSCIKGAEYGPYEWGFIALRAIVELHKPISDNSCSDPGCCGGPYPDLCGICSEHYPCETIEAIQGQLSTEIPTPDEA